MSWFSKLLPSKIRTDGVKKKEVPEGLWTKCPECLAFLFRSELERNLEVCPKCSFHLRLKARQRLDFFLDPAFREELATEVVADDRLKFRDTKKYKDRLSAAQKETGEKDALVVIRGQLKACLSSRLLLNFLLLAVRWVPQWGSVLYALLKVV